jgi:hypothetical protein
VRAAPATGAALRRTTVTSQRNGASSSSSDAVIPPPPTTTTGASYSVTAPCSPHDVAPACTCSCRRPASSRASACSAVGSAYDPLAQVQVRDGSSDGAKASTPANGSCTQRADGAPRTASTIPSTSVGPSHTSASGWSARSTTTPPPSWTAVTTASDGVGARAMRGGVGPVIGPA